MWKAVKISDVCEFQSGLWKGKNGPFTNANVIRNTNFRTNGNLSYENIAFFEVETKELSKRQLQHGDIILEKSGGGEKTPVGRVCLFEKQDSKIPFSLSNFTCFIRVKEPSILDYKYLHKFLYFMYEAGKTEPMQRNSTGIRNLQLKEYKDISIALPPILEQQRIVTKLDVAFAEIDRAIKIAKDSSIKTQELFKKELAKTFLTNHEGWIKTTIEESCGIKSGITLKKNLEKSVGDIPYLKVADMNLESNSIEITTSSRYIMRADISDKVIFRKGSVIFPKRGGAIATNKKRLTKIDICVDLNIMSVHPLTSLSPQLLYYFFLNVDMTKLGSGSSIPQINHYDILPLAITYPSNEDEQLKLVKKLKTLKQDSESLSKIYYKKMGELKKLKSLVLEQKLQPREAA